jgi:hypothetical protein
MSHPIRGAAGDKATEEQQLANCNLAKGIAGKIRNYLLMNYRDADADVYVPAEHEDFVHRTFSTGMLTVQQILCIDCQIIEETYNDLLLIFAPYGPPVEGCHVEWQHARKCGIPIIIFKDMSEFKQNIEAFMEAGGYEYE